jgi:hypothetical protein
MFQYCRAVLRLSEGSAYNRIETARAARRHPAIGEMLVSGDLTPTTARLLARHLTAENHQELLAAASGKGKQAVEELLARWFPQADVAARVRRLRSAPLVMGEPVAPSSPPSVAVSLLELPVRAAGAPGDGPILPQVAAMPPAVVRPLAPERYEIRFTATAETRERLRRAQDLLAHAIPSGDIAQVVDRALMLLVADLERKKFAATPRSHRSRGQAEHSRNIPAEVKRGVVARDEGRCRFVAANGRRCGERRFLEFHHVIPYAAGGKPTLDNIELRCRAHNGYEAERFYGPGARRGRGGRQTRSGTSAPPPPVRPPPGAVG